MSVAPRLRLTAEYKRVFIATDMTKLERGKHKKIVEELKRRRSNGESGIFIRNGNIVQRRPRPEAVQCSAATSAPVESNTSSKPSGQNQPS